MSAVREELSEWMHLVRSDSHVLRERPSVLFQQAANLPDDSAPSRSARSRIESGLETRPWFRLINKPRRGSTLHATLQGHTRDVHCCAVSPDGSRVISGSADETLRLWDAESGAYLEVLAEGEGEVMRCAFSPDGDYIAASFRTVEGSIYQHRVIRVWDARSLRVVGDLRVEGEQGGVIALVFLTGRRLLAGYYAGPLRLWNVESGELLRVVAADDSQEEGIGDLDVSSSGDRIATIHGAALAGEPYGRNVKVWDGGTFDLLAHFQFATNGRPKACAFSLPGDQLVVVGQGLLKAWDTTTWIVRCSVRDRMGLW
jgi:WD40 repeat protein